MNAFIKSILDSNNPKDNPWQWYALEYRRTIFGKIEVMFQMGRSENDAIQHAKASYPRFRFKKK